MKIVAIGGGEIKNKETLSIDRFIVGLTKKSSPRVLFIPTASGDANSYCETFDRIYGKILGCRTDNLRLLSCVDDRRRAKEKILKADLIYIGGGNTLRMMKLWRRLGIDKLLKQAGNNGVVLSGISAGASCWHQWSHSNSRSFSGNPNWSFIRVKGLGFVKGFFCPHVVSEKRQNSFKKMVAQHNVLGIACEDNAAIYYDNKKVTVITSSKKSAVYIYEPVREKVMVRKYINGEQLNFTEKGDGPKS